MAYFDNAATTYPKPECVYSFMDEFYRNHGGSAGRGNYALANSAKGVVEETRDLLKNYCTALRSKLFSRLLLRLRST